MPHIWLKFPINLSLFRGANIQGFIITHLNNGRPAERLLAMPGPFTCVIPSFLNICFVHLRPLPNSQIPKFSNRQFYSIFFWFLTRNFLEMPKGLN